MSLKEKIITLCFEYKVRDLYVFGSRADEILAMVNHQSKAAGKNGFDKKFFNLENLHCLEL